MSTWETRRIADVLRKLEQAYYRRKYGTLAQRMGRPGLRPDDQPGFIIVQIDGLAHDHLLEAIKAEYLPNLKRMIGEGRLLLRPWNCGLPSTTPAVQAGIMFGNRDNIPGFRWYEKESGLSFVAKRPAQVQALQARLKGERRGILVGGSSYVNMFDGDADLALFTLAALGPQRLFESARGIGLLMLFLLNPVRVVRLLGLIAANYLRGLRWRFATRRQRSVINPYDLLAPLLSATVNVLFTEVQTFGVILDIYRGVPSIYTNYNTYDEAAHHFGATHRVALAALRDIDWHIAQIDRMRSHHHGRTYDLYILSDHGNQPSVPFGWEMGQSLGRFISDQLGQASFDEVYGLPDYTISKARYLLDEVMELEQKLPRTAQRIVRALRHYVDRLLPADPEGEHYNLERREDIVIRVSGPLAHVYFNITQRRLDMIEVTMLYPHLLDRLTTIKSIGLVIGQSGGRTIVLGTNEGSAVIDDENTTVEPPNPLTAYGPPEQMAQQIHQLANFFHSGDLILIGGTTADGRVVTFENQLATHGGIGGVQEQAFIATPPAVGLNSLDDPCDLYDFFQQRYLHK